jgi:UDP:flavonoid glycosyltransferase YjiC (YdhE family)
MRVLFTGVPALGHVLPLLPLARAFQRQEHEVSIMVPPSMAPAFQVERAELLANGADMPSIVAELTRRTCVDPKAGLTPAIETEFFAGTRVDLSASQSLTVARAWRPDLIIHDMYDLVAPLVAAALNVPSALFMLGPTGSDVNGRCGYSPEFARAADSILAERYRARGLTPQPAKWVLDVCPPALRQDNWRVPRGWIPLRPEAHRLPDGTPTPPVQPLRGKSRILVTFGTVFADPVMLSPILRALSASGRSLRVTLGGSTSIGNYDVDDHRVNFEPFLPLHELLTGIELVVAAGGAGTTLATLGAGIPMVIVPQGADQFVYAERAAAAGAALQFLPDAVSPGAVTRAVRTVLADPSFRAGARKIAEQVSAMPPADEVAATLASALA